jgi:hypothetical protein
VHLNNKIHPSHLANHQWRGLMILYSFPVRFLWNELKRLKFSEGNKTESASPAGPEGA